MTPDFYINLAKTTLADIETATSSGTDAKGLKEGLINAFSELDIDVKIKFISQLVSSKCDDSFLKRENALEQIRLKSWLVKALIVAGLGTLAFSVIIFTALDLFNPNSKIATFFIKTKSLLFFLFT